MFTMDMKQHNNKSFSFKNEREGMGWLCGEVNSSRGANSFLSEQVPVGRCTHSLLRVPIFSVPDQGSYRREKTKFPDISLTQIQISLTKTIGDRQNIFSPKLLLTMRP